MKQSHAAGFILAEALAAVAITAIGAVGLILALSAAHGRTVEASARDRAVRQAMAVLHSLPPAPLDEPLTGVLTDGSLSWRIERQSLGSTFPDVDVVRISIQSPMLKDKADILLEAYVMNPGSTDAR